MSLITETRLFPIQSKYINSIPWAMIAPHELQALRNHGNQGLEELSRRGGLSTMEAYYVLTDQRYDGPWFVLPRDREARDTKDRQMATRIRGMVQDWSREIGVRV